MQPGQVRDHGGHRSLHQDTGHDWPALSWTCPRTDPHPVSPPRYLPAAAITLGFSPDCRHRPRLTALVPLPHRQGQKRSRGHTRGGRMARVKTNHAEDSFLAACGTVAAPTGSLLNRSRS